MQEIAKEIIIIQNSIKTVYGFRRSYIKKLIKLGCRVIILAPNDCVNSREKLITLGAEAPLINNRSGFLGMLLVTFQLNLILLFLRFSTPKANIVCHFLVTFLMVGPLLFILNKKVYLYVEGLGSIFSKNSNKTSLLRWLMLRSNVTRIFCNNDEKNRLGQDKDLVTNGIGISLQKFKLQDRSCILGRDINLLYVGRLIKDKGAHDVIDAYRQLAKVSNKSFTLTMLGDTYKNNPSSLTKAEINTYAKEFNGKLSFPGFSHNPEQFYQNADILVLPSKREGFPVCVMEANAMGLPAVCYNVAGCSDAIQPGVNGVLVQYKDITALAEAINQLADEALLKKYHYSARQYAEANFNDEIKSDFFVNYITRKL